jgi:hypothetical protein
MNSIQATLFHIPMALGSILLTLDDLKFYAITNVTNMSHETLMTSVFLISLIYFLIDTYLMYVYYESRHNIYFFHHLLALIGLPLCYFVRWDYAIYVMYYMTFELSTPVYNLTYALHKRGYKSSDMIFWISQWLFVILFFSIRVIFGSYTTFTLIMSIYADTSVSNLYMIPPICLQSLMLYWLNSIVKKVL